MTRRYWGLTACVMLLFASGVVVSPSAGAIPGSGCTRPIVISRLAFGPGTILPNQKSTARLAGRNCSKHPQQLSLTWLGQYVGSDLTGCPVIDPLAQDITVPASSALNAHLAFVVPKDCTSKLLTVTTRLTDKAGKRISTKTASLRIAHKPVKGS